MDDWIQGRVAKGNWIIRIMAKYLKRYKKMDFSNYMRFIEILANVELKKVIDLLDGALDRNRQRLDSKSEDNFRPLLQWIARGRNRTENTVYN